MGAQCQPAKPNARSPCVRTSFIKASGGDPFRDYSFPEAILELRQGVGRLIRPKQDKGIAIILNPRVLTKNYGNVFLRSLPKCPVEGM